MIVYQLARPLLAAVFVWGGVETLRNPEPRVKAAGPFLEKALDTVKDSLPDQVPTDPTTLVRLDAAVKIVAGLGLAVGRFPRLSALVLAASMVPTTMAGHPYWEHEDPAVRAAQQTHFMKNLSLIGGLLATAAAPSRDKRGRKSQRATKKNAR